MSTHTSIAVPAPLTNARQRPSTKNVESHPTFARRFGHGGWFTLGRCCGAAVRNQALRAFCGLVRGRRDRSVDGFSMMCECDQLARFA
jgi:hypothetical protein